MWTVPVKGCCWQDENNKMIISRLKFDKFFMVLLFFIYTDNFLNVRNRLFSFLNREQKYIYLSTLKKGLFMLRLHTLFVFLFLVFISAYGAQTYSVKGVVTSHATG